MFVEPFQAFEGKPLYEYTKAQHQEIRDRIERENEDYILQVSEPEYVQYLLDEFIIDTLRIDFSAVYVNDYEKEFSAEELPGLFIGRRGKTKRQVIVYHLPFTGDASFLRYEPTSTPNAWSYEVFVLEQCLCFEIINLYDTPEQIDKEADDIISKLKTLAESISGDLDNYNNALKGNIEGFFKARKERILKQRNLLSSLKVPYKKRENLPQTFAVPTPQFRKSVTTKPYAVSNGYASEPPLDQEVYQDILQTIHDVGKVMERLPSIYQGRAEEDLRDLLLLYLEPRYEGSATGETFNGRGKTDILMRYNNSNIFIAECKFWDSQNHYLKGISQLLHDLTWRDTEAAVILFVKNKGFSSVLQTIEEITLKHPNCLGFTNKQDETWLNYRFHLNGDPNREVKLAVLLFHFPS